MRREMDQYGVGTASFIEIFWTIVCAIGALICSGLLSSAIGDLNFMRRSGINGDRSLVAIDVVVGKAIYVVVLWGFTIIGVAAMFTPSPNPSGKPSALSIFITVVFVMTAVVFTTHSILRWRWREEYIRRRIARHDASESATTTMVIDTEHVDSLEITTRAVETDES